VQKLTAPQHLQSASNTALPQYSPSTELLSRCETSAETHCTNSITNPVIENNKQITEQQDQKLITQYFYIEHITKNENQV